MDAPSPTATKPVEESRIEHRYAQLDQVRLHYVERVPEGVEDPPVVILLHGFPEFWYAWRYQIEPLAAAGFRVIAPDMRGYNLSDKPAGVVNYRVEALAADVAQLVRELGCEKAHIVGHDWGGFVAWWFAMTYPSALERLVVMNAPHPGHGLAMLADPEQLRRSWYMFFFQLPVLPERRMIRNDYEVVRRTLLAHTERKEAFSSEDLDRYVRAFTMAGPRPMLDYYRALFRRNPLALRRELRPINAPVQVIWGKKDRNLLETYAEPPPRWVWDVRVDYVDDAAHWVQSDRPETVNQLLLDFLRPDRN